MVAVEVLIFDFWILILVFLVAIAFWKKNALFLLIAGLGTVAFGNVLAFDGLRVVSGVDKATGAFTYLTLLPTNDQLIAIISILALPLGIALSLFSIVVLYSELIGKYRLFKS